MPVFILIGLLIAAIIILIIELADINRNPIFIKYCIATILISVGWIYISVDNLKMDDGKLYKVYNIEGSQYIKLDEEKFTNLNKKLGLVVPDNSKVKETSLVSNWSYGLWWGDTRAFNKYEIVKEEK